MTKLNGKIVEFKTADTNNVGFSIGSSLKKLRKLSGVTQKEMAARLNVKQSSVSKLEGMGDHQISSIRRYIEALGAQLHIDASFPANSDLSMRIIDAFDEDFCDENQLVFPILRDDPFPNKRDVVLSIKPFYTDKIIKGLKTVELRRRFPIAAPKGTLAYIYSTSPVRAMVGMANIQEVIKLPVEQIWHEFSEHAFIARDKFEQYFEGLNEGYALKFTNVRTFQRPLHLSELRVKFGFEPPQSYLYAKHDLRKALRNEQAIVSH